MERRTALQLVVIGPATPLVAQEHRHAPAAAAPAKPRFFSPAQRAMVDELTEMIIPTDSHSPGARQAGVATFVDGVLADSGDDARQAWAQGLDAVNAEASKRFGAQFMEITAAQRDEVMKEMAAGEENPKNDLHRFFVRLKAQTLSGYYTSSVGLLKDLQYKGIVPLAEFPACNHPDHHRPAKRP